MATQSRTFHLLGIGKPVDLPFPFKLDGILIFRSTSRNLTQSSASENTAFNFLNNKGDITLHISFRRPSNTIVFNAKTAAGDWGPQESIQLRASFVGHSTTIAVYDHGDRLQILISGSTVHNFNKRIDGDVTRASYTSNDDTSPFSDPVALETYQNFAALVPGTL